MTRPRSRPAWPWPDDRDLAEVLHIATLNVEARALREVGPDGPGGRGISEEWWCGQVAIWWGEQVHAHPMLREADPDLIQAWGHVLLIEEGHNAHARAQAEAHRKRLLADRVGQRRGTRAFYLDEWDDAIEVLNRVDPAKVCGR